MESNLLRSLSDVGKYNARDMADLAFLYLIALHILRVNFDSAPMAQKYAVQSQSTDWSFSKPSGTDLYQLLHILIEQNKSWIGSLKNPAASQTLMGDLQLDPMDVKRFLNNVHQEPYNTDLARRLLLRFESQLRIQNSNYRSVRRIAADWLSDLVTTEAQSLALTRLIQAMNHKAIRGDLRHALEQMATQQKLLLTTACNPETGQNCAATTEPRQGSLLGTLAKTAGLTVGAYLLGKALFSK